MTDALASGCLVFICVFLWGIMRELVTIRKLLGGKYQ